MMWVLWSLVLPTYRSPTLIAPTFGSTPEHADTLLSTKVDVFLGKPFA